MAADSNRGVAYVKPGHAGVQKINFPTVALNKRQEDLEGPSAQTDLAQGLPLINCDRVQFEQVILNLILNAIEAMSGVDGGTRELLISTREAEPNGVLVGVRDSGPGLAPTILGRVFDAFYTAKSGGLGMGLSICRSIVEAHGGRLWATGHTLRGALFQFTIPARPT